MMRWIRRISPLLVVLMILTGCQGTAKEEIKNKYSNQFFEYFDTITNVIGYADSQEEFDGYFEEIKAEYKTYHELFDIYNSYDGINNIKTINEKAGIEPVKVDSKIIDMILFSKEWFGKTNGKANIAMGSVLELWHETREDAESNPEDAKLPDLKELQEASLHTNLDDVIVNVEESTVFLKDPKMRLDVGAVAKGYATERVTDHMREKGYSSFIISAGGNVKALDKPMDGTREKWGIGIQNPDATFFTDMESLDTVFGNNISVVTSGDYQRFYMVGGKAYHHIIDNETLMPGDHFKAVTVIMEDSGLADFMSTTVFLSSLEDGKKMLEDLGDAYGVWVTQDNEIILSDGMDKYLKSLGATNAK